MAGRFIIGVDLGGTNLKIALLDLKYKIRRKFIFSTEEFVKKESLISAIIDSINKIIKEDRLTKSNILGVGLGLPGPINTQQGIVHFFPNIPGWQEVNLKKILERRLRLPVVLDNDANLMSWAEFKLGAAKGFKNALCLTLGTGVGSGIIIDATLYRGLSFAAGEIGHLPLNEQGPRCSCGGIGCLERYVGNRIIMQEAKRLFRRRVSLEELSRLAKKRNQKAVGLWSRVGRHLGIGLSGIVNFFNPDVIVIGGGVASAGKILFDQVRQTIKKRAMPIQARHVKICKARLGSDAGLIGAAILVKEGLG